MVPWSGTETAKPVADYSAFGLPEGKITDSPNNLVVTPEFTFRDAARTRRTNVAVWWMSTSNSVPVKLLDAIRSKKIRRIRRETRARIFSGEMYDFFRVSYAFGNRVTHFSQSEYIRSTIRAKLSISSELLTDYVWDPQLQPQPTKARSRQKILSQIAYNPKKGGYRKVLELMGEMPGWHWVPISSMTHDEVITTLKESLVFIDFGFFPGKDRLPREAILAGTPVIISKRGNAASSEDFALGDEFKILFEDGWRTRTKALIHEIQLHRGMFLTKQAKFYEQVLNQREQFSREVKQHFFLGH